MGEDASELKDTEAAESSRPTHTREWLLPSSEPSISLRDKATSRVLSTIPVVALLSHRFNSEMSTSTNSELSISLPSKACTLVCSSTPDRKPPSRLETSSPLTPCPKELLLLPLRLNSETEVPSPVLQVPPVSSSVTPKMAERPESSSPPVSVKPSKDLAELWLVSLLVDRDAISLS